MKNTKNNMLIVDETIPNGRVLIVDDKDMSLYIAKGMLSLYGLLIDTAKSGYEAIEKIKHNMYDLVLMDHDHMMPEMNSIETTRKVRKWENDEFLRKYGVEFPQEAPKLL